MTDKKRKSKRPKAIQAKTRVTTEATKAKLPRPRSPKARNEAPIPRVQCPRCEKWVPDHPHDIHSCYDAKAVREERTPSPIAGQPLDCIGSQPAPDFRAILCGKDVVGKSFDGAGGRTYTIQEQGIGVKWTPPDTSAYPWPIKAANWLDDRIVSAQRGLSRALSRLAVAIKRLAWKVAP